MAFFVDSITLIDRNTQVRTPKTGTDGVPNGDLVPWRVRMELVNTGGDNVDNSGTLTLRIDEKKTFIKTGPLFMEEDAKTKYLIECKITQTIEGTSTESKYWMFQIGTPSISVDKQNGALLTIQLQEIQRRTQEVFTSRELRFLTPRQALSKRLADFQNFENSWGNPSGNKPVNVNINPTTGNNLPEAPELEYVPQIPTSIKSLLDGIFNGLAQSTSQGGVFTDYYYDYDPATDIDKSSSPHSLRTYLYANKIGAIDSGAVIDPESAEAVDSEQEQDANTDFFEFRNHIIARGDATSGTLPRDHEGFASNWLHAKIRPEWVVGGGNNGSQYTGNFYYLKGMTVKKTYTLTAFPSEDPVNVRQRTIQAKKIVRFFMAIKDVTSNADPTTTTGHTFWKEDFLLYPEFEKTGHYEAGDVVYYEKNSNEFRFYQAEEDIYDWSLNRFRYWQDSGGGNGTYPANTMNASGLSTKHLSNSSGFLQDPDESESGFADRTSTIPKHEAITYVSNDVDINGTSSFTGWEGFSPWTSDVFDWEKNMAGLSGTITNGVLPYGATAGKKDPTNGLPNNGYTSNRYVGLIPDWNMSKDVYDKQDPTDEFENITMKWVTKISDTPPTAVDVYHGQRIILGTGAVATNWTYNNYRLREGNDPNGTILTNSQCRGRLAQFVYNQEDPSKSHWYISRYPQDGDTFNNLDDGKVYQWNATTNTYDAMWKIKRESSDDLQNISYSDTLTPFHIVKDIYKTKGFDGTPNNAIEVRYAMDPNNVNHQYNSQASGYRSSTIKYTTGNADKESVACRKNSRGVWLWFWLPFPRIAHSDDGAVAIGDKYGGNGSTPSPKSGYTTLNINNNATDSRQSLKGWNNGANSEDMGRIASLSFRIKVGIYALESDETNDDYFWEIPNYYRVIGEANIPMTFWCIDIFDRIWTHKFSHRKNGFWDEITIPFGEMGRKNLHIPRFDELLYIFGDRPLGFTNFALPEREYTGVAFDWRFVKGWGIQMDSAYDKENGYYHGGLDYALDKLSELGETIKQGIWNAGAEIANSKSSSDIDSTYINNKHPKAWAWHNQATIALDGVHFNKELIVNTNKEFKNNARTSVINIGNITDKITLKNTAKSALKRASFFPQYWNISALGDVRIRVGHSFKVKGDRMPNLTDMDGVTAYNSGQTYNRGDKVSSGGYVYQALQAVPTNTTPSNINYWENLNQLVVSEVHHVVDSTGYKMSITARRKFILTGEE